MVKEYYDNKKKILTLPCDFNDELKNVPIETEIINFIDDEAIYLSRFNQPIKNLPQNIKKINFGWYFNQPVDNLPKTMTELKYGFKFNQPVDNLPINLTHLTFNTHFNQPLDKLPKNLLNLAFSTISNFNQPLDNLPKNLYYLKIGIKFNNKIIIPDSVKEICLLSNNILLNNLPNNIEILTINFDHIVNGSNIKIDNLPITLKKIIIKREEYKKYIIKIPYETVIIIDNFL